MQQNTTWEANSHSASQEIPRLLRNPKDHYCLHKSRPLVPLLCHVHPVHIFQPYFHKIQSNIIFPSTPKYFEWIFPSGCLTKISYSFLVSLMRAYMSGPSHSPWLDHSNNIWRSIHVKKFLIIQSSPVSCHFLPLRSKYSPQQPVLKYPQSMLFPVIIFCTVWTPSFWRGDRKIKYLEENSIKHSPNLTALNAILVYYCHFLYLNFDIFSKDFLAISKLWTFTAFLWRNITTHLVFSVFTSIPTSCQPLTELLYFS